MKNYLRLALCALAVLIFGSVSVDAQNITTVVGGGPVGLAPTTNAVGTPAAVRFDSTGNMYILDNFFSRVLKVDSTTGLVSVYAGNGTNGFSGDGGAATSAQMNAPSGMCIDLRPGPAQNTIYIADSDNAVMRKVTPAGVISTFAGVPTPTNMTFGGDGGVATSAHLHFPDGCSLDSAGNVYIADRGNNEIRVVYEGGTVPTGLTGPLTAGNIYKFAGGTDGAPPTPPSNNGGFSADGTLAQVAALYGPFDVFVDTTVTPNNVYYTEIGNNYNPDGSLPTTGPTNNNIIREILGADDTIHTVAGKQGVFGADNNVAAVGAAINEPKGLSVDAAGNIFFADQVNHVIREVPKATGVIGVVAGHLGANNSGYAGDGNPAASALVSLTFPSGTLVDAAGNIYIADQDSDAVRLVPSTTGGGKTSGDIYTVAGNGRLSFGGDGAAATHGELNTPVGITVNATGDLAFADSGSDLIRGVGKSTGNLATLAGAPESNGFLNTPPSSVNVALGVAVDASGNLFIADSQNCLVRKLNAGGISTIAGIEPTIVNPDNALKNLPVCGFVAAGTAAVGTKLGVINSVAVDSNGNVFFSDATNHVIWEVPAATAGTMVAGNAYIIAGKQGTAGGTGDTGPAAQAELSSPAGLYIDVFNNLFIADFGNNRVREIPAVNAGTMVAGNIYTIAGNGTAGATGDGAPAINAELNGPFAVVVDHSGSVFIADSNNQAVREVAGANVSGKTTGDIYTVAGTKGTAGFKGDGAAALSAQLNGPKGLALLPETGNTTGDLLISDSVNNRIRSVAGIANLAPVPVPLASLSPSPLAFTAEPVGTASAASIITLTNTGGATLNITAPLAINGTNAGDFTETDNCSAAPATVAAGATCTINVTFKPTAAGARTATLTVVDNAGTQTVALSGSGTAVTTTLTVKDTDASSSQTVTAGATATYNLSVTANNAVTATITCTGAPTDATCTPTPASIALTAGTAGTFKVAVTTTARGAIMPFNQPSTKIQPPSAMQLVPMASLALLFAIVVMFTWMQNPAGRMRTLRVALSVCLILMPVAAATMLVGCGGGSSSTTPPPPPPATGTPAGTYTIVVTATSGSATSSANLTLVVN